MIAVDITLTVKGGYPRMLMPSEAYQRLLRRKGLVLTQTGVYPITENTRNDCPEHMDRYRFLARAAIEAMMEPTPAALLAAQTDTDPDIARVVHDNRAKLYSEPF